jgi:hypothetical protein
MYNGQSEVSSHLCLEVASKLANFSQLAWALDCRCEVRTLGSTLHFGHAPKAKRSEFTNGQSDKALNLRAP